MLDKGHTVRTRSYKPPPLFFSLSLSTFLSSPSPLCYYGAVRTAGRSPSQRDEKQHSAARPSPTDGTF